MKIIIFFGFEKVKHLISKYKNKIDFCFDLGTSIGFDSYFHCVVLSKRNMVMLPTTNFNHMTIEHYIRILFWSESVFEFISNSNMWHQMIYGFRHSTQQKLSHIKEELSKENSRDEFQIHDHSQWGFIFVSCKNIPSSLKHMLHKVEQSGENIYRADLTQKINDQT